MNKLFYFKEEAITAAHALVEKGAIVTFAGARLYNVDIDEVFFDGDVPTGDFPCIEITLYDGTWERWGWVKEVKTLGDLARMAERTKGVQTPAFVLACFEHSWRLTNNGYSLSDLAYDPINHEVLTYDPEFGYIVRLGKPRLAKLSGGGGRPEDQKPVNEIEF